MMRLLARLRDARFRGSAHSLRSAFNHFTLVEPFPNGKLYFKRTVDRPVCVYVVEDKLFVLATELQVFTIALARGDSFTLKNGSDGRLYSLGHSQDDDTFVPKADRTAADAWEMFDLGVPPRLDHREHAAIASIDMLIDRLGDADTLAALGNEGDAAIIGACVASVSGSLMADRRFARALEAAFPQDPHAEAFRRLLEGSPATDTEIALGELWRTGVDGSVPTLPFAVNCLARQRWQPTKKICMLATLRNEAPYIVEWLAYHRSIGIERFFIYENDSQDGSHELVDRLADHGLIDVVHNVVDEGGNAQSSAYAHALGLRPELLDYEWCVIIDLDEFLLLNDPAFTTIGDVLDTSAGREADAIAVNWIVYGPNGRLQRDRGRSVMDTFAWRHAQPDRHIKSILRPRHFFTASAHYPYRYRTQPFIFVDPLGRPHIPLDGETAWSSRPDESRIGLAHYVYKSLDEFLLKWSRNRGDNPRRLEATNEVLTKEALEAFVAVFHERGVVDTPMRARSVQADAEARCIRALPGIAAIEADIDARYAQTIGGIREMFLDCPAVRASEMGPHFRELIRLAATQTEI